MSESVDIWAAGCILFTMLCGHQPFYSKYSKDLIDQIKESKPCFDYDVWQDVSEKAKHLVNLLLEKNPNKRPNVISVLRHSWFSKDSNNYHLNKYAHSKFKMNLLKNQRILVRNPLNYEFEELNKTSKEQTFTVLPKEVRFDSFDENAVYFSV